MKKKIVSALSVLILIFMLASCDKTDYTTTYIDYNPSTSADCIVQTEYMEKCPAVYSFDTEKSFSDNLKKLASKKPGTVICLNSDSKTDIVGFAKKNGKINFVIQDLELNGIPNNMICVNVDYFTMSFLMGNLAGRVTKSSHVAFISEIKTSVSNRLADGFQAGAEFASNGGECENLFADEENSDILSLAEKAADDGCDVVFVYTIAHFGDIKKILAGRNISVIAVGEQTDDTVIGSFSADMTKIYGDIQNKISEGDSFGSRLTYGYNFFKINVSESASVLTEEIKSGFADDCREVSTGEFWIDETPDEQDLNM